MSTTICIVAVSVNQLRAPSNVTIEDGDTDSFGAMRSEVWYNVDLLRGQVVLTDITFVLTGHEHC